MGNMSYCRFENTSDDLADCVEALIEMDHEEPVSEGEHEARIRLVRLCAEIVFDFAGAKSIDEAVQWAECLEHEAPDVD